MNHQPLLESTKLQQDPRVIEAKNLLMQAVIDHQKNIQGVKPPIKERVSSYEDLLKTFQEYRGGPLYFPYIGSGFGNGALVELFDGSVKYDFISGIGPHYWGHNSLSLLSSSIEAALCDTIMQGHLQQNIDSLEISELLIQASGMDHCFLSSSGVMANENGLKIAFQKKYPANRVLAFDKCFMGRTLALSQVTDKANFREGLPSNMAVDYIPFYRADDPEGSKEQAINTLKKHLTRYPNQHALMCFELVQGEGGFYPGTSDFFLSLMQILKEHQITILVDEVQTFGRTPSLFAYQYFNLQEFVDIVTIGKLAQVCATLFRKDLKPRPGLLSQTFTSSTAAIHASKVIIQSLMQDNYLGPQGKIVKIHQEFVQHFQNLEKKFPGQIRGPYGIGSMLAFTPFDGETKRVTQFIQSLFKAGVISFIAGSQPSRVRFLIPIGAITSKDIEEAFLIIENVLKVEAS